MALDADIYHFRQRVAPSFALSAAFHLGLAAFLIFVPALLHQNGESWGNGGSGGAEGEAISAHLVGGVPLPSNPHASRESVLATQSKGLAQSQPAVKSKVDERAIALPDRNAKKKNEKNSHETATTASVRKPVVNNLVTPSRVKPLEQPRVDNSIPFGEGPTAAGPYTTFAVGNTSGGMQFGEGGSGSFGTRFGWYTDVVARKVHQAWQSEVNPGVLSARRVYITFDISRGGSPSNVRIEQSSGIPSLDQSAVRALQRIDTFGPLPQGYNGSYVSVEFWFDYRR